MTRVTVTDIDALVQTVREALNPGKRFADKDAAEALDALAHELKRLKVGRDDMAEAYRELEAELERQRGYTKDEAVQTILAKEFGSEQFQRAEAAEAEREHVQQLREREHIIYRKREDALKAAEASLDKALAERDEARASIKTIIKEDGVVVSRQARKLDKALAALRKIAVSTSKPGVDDVHMDIARAALREIEGEA